MDGCNVDKNLQKSMALVGEILALAFGCQRLSTASGALEYTLFDRDAGNDTRGTELARA